MREMFYEARMSGRPEFYSGRGPNAGDLGPSALATIYQLVLAHHGANAAEAMIRTVLAVPVLGATEGMYALYDLERAEYKAPPVAESGVETFVRSAADSLRDGEGGVGAVFGGLSALVNDRRSPGGMTRESNQIKAGFLQRIGRRDLMGGLDPRRGYGDDDGYGSYGMSGRRR